MKAGFLVVLSTALLAAVRVGDDTTSCRTYDPGKVSVVAPRGGVLHSSEWAIESTGTAIEEALNKRDAENIATIARQYTEECRIGPPKHLIPVVTFWKGNSKPLVVDFPEDCISYDPRRLEYSSGRVTDTTPVPNALKGTRASVRFGIEVPGEKQGNAVLALARQGTSVCVIGGFGPQISPDLELRAHEDLQGRRELEDAQNAWHPVYYWK